VGLVKAALSVHHAAIAPNLNLRRLNPELDLDSGRLFVPTEPAGWPQDGETRYAAVSSFGAGGTNAHVILGSAPPPRPEPDTGIGAGDESDRAPVLLPISAATADALKPMAAAFRDMLAAPSADMPALTDIARAATFRRTQHEHRCGVVATSADQAAERLTAWLDAQAPTQVVTGRSTAPVGRRVVFVCPGQGAQHPGMGWDLLEHCAAFREALHACDEAMRPLLGRSIAEEIARIGPDSGVEIVQPALFAISVALAARLQSLGLRPDFVIGHSMGEVAAAHIAGALSLEDAARIMCRRSAMLSRIAGRGAMLLVAQGAAEMESLVAERSELVSLAASNGPMSTVLSGEAAALDEIQAELATLNVFARRVKVEVASHSPQVDRLLDELRSELADIAPRRGTVPIMSTVTGELCDGSGLDAAYWARNLRSPVRFWEATRTLCEHDAGVFVELGPHPVLSAAVEQTLEQAEHAGLALPAMRRDQPALETSTELFGTLWANAHPATASTPADDPVRAVALPAYAWQHQKLWFRAPGDVPRPAAAKPPAWTAIENGAVVKTALATCEQLSHDELAVVVTDAVATVLHLAPADVDPRMGFFQMGMDSMLAARVRSLIEATLERGFPARVMFEHPTADALTAFLAGAAKDEDGGSQPPPADLGIVPALEESWAADADAFAHPLTEDELLAALVREMPTPIDDKAGRA
jgi:myxalamid-type polyketide synthase MxaE and MxaD